MARIGSLAAGALLLLAAPAWAGESLINGQPLRYNHEYRCGGERVVVGHCRSNDDASNCQVYYPDRPFHNGVMVEPVEQRGAIIAKLSACAANASAPTATAGPAPEALPSAPGLGRASWRVLSLDAKAANFYTEKDIRRAGGSAEGWLTQIYSRPRDDASLGLKDVQFAQAHARADCADNAIEYLGVAFYDEDSKPIGFSRFRAPAFRSVASGGSAAAQVNVLCGRPQPLADEAPLVGTGEYILVYYLERLRLANGDSLANGPR